MKKNLFLLLFALFFHIVEAQNLFNYVFYDNNNTVQVYATLETHERDFIFLTNTRIFRADTLGNVLWSKAMNGLQFSAITATKDSNYVLVGGEDGWMNSDNVCCIKIDKNGDTLWTKHIDLGGLEYLYYVQELIEGGYIVAGYQTINNNDERLLVAKLDTIGNVSWVKTFNEGGGSNERLYAIKQTPDSGFIATGYANGAVLMKLSKDGNLDWAKRTQQQGIGYDVVVKDKDYMWLLNNGNGILAKLDSSGNIITHTSYTTWVNTNIDVTPFIPPAKLHAISNNRYLFSFKKEGTYADVGFPFTITDSSGNVIWSNNVSMYFQDAIETYNHGFLAIGNGPLQGMKQATATYDNPHVGVAKLDSLGYGGICTNFSSVDTITNLFSLSNISLTSTNLTNYQLLPYPSIQNVTTLMDIGCVDITGDITDKQTPLFSIYPNPSAGIFQFQQTADMPISFDIVEVYNAIGEKVAYINPPNSSSFEIDLSLQPEGVYFVVVYHHGEMGTQSVVIKRK